MPRKSGSATMPTKLLPDTCAWIDFLNARSGGLAGKLEQALLQGEVATCGVVLFELIQGLKNPEEESQVLNAFQAIPHLEMTTGLWIKAGQLSSELRKKGQTLPLSDIIIATLALEHDLTVLTIDRHFQTIPGLAVITGK